MSNPDDAYKTGYARRAKAIVDAARAAARIAALEDAERACEALATRWLENSGMGDARMAARACAQSIRALTKKEQANG